MRYAVRADCFNHVRAIASQSLYRTLEECVYQPSITERIFRKKWLMHLYRFPEIVADGWYTPPPFGMSVIAANEENWRRMNYTSLRDKSYWPSDREIDWRKDMLYVFCSPVSRDTGTPGDFGATVYFGENTAISRHVRICYAATREVLHGIHAGLTAAQLFRNAEYIFLKHRVCSSVTSITDQNKANLGHHLPSLSAGSLGSRLKHAQMEWLRVQRRFITTDARWPLSSVGQFSVEPRLRSLDDPMLPQVGLHYLVAVDKDVAFQDDCDAVAERYHVYGI